MTHDDRELEGWRSEWATLGDVASLAKTLGPRVTRDRRRLALEAAGEVGGSAFAIALSGWLIVRSNGNAVVTVTCVPILVFMGVWLTRFFAVRRGLFGGTGESVQAFVDITLRRLRANLEWATFARRCVVVLCALTVPWGLWVLLSRLDAYRAAPWRAVIGFGVPFFTFGVLAIVGARKIAKLKREISDLEDLVARATLD